MNISKIRNLVIVSAVVLSTGCAKTAPEGYKFVSKAQDVKTYTLSNKAASEIVQDLFSKKLDTAKIEQNILEIPASEKLSDKLFTNKEFLLACKYKQDTVRVAFLKIFKNYIEFFSKDGYSKVERITQKNILGVETTKTRTRHFSRYNNSIASEQSFSSQDSAKTYGPRYRRAKANLNIRQ